MRKALASLTVDQVNGVIRKHLNPRDMSVVIVTKDAAALQQALVSTPSRQSNTTARSQRT